MQFEQRQQLLIDRDLKPTNVRVATKRGTGKLLDFAVERQAPVSSRLTA